MSSLGKVLMVPFHPRHDPGHTLLPGLPDCSSCFFRKGGGKPHEKRFLLLFALPFCYAAAAVHQVRDRAYLQAMNCKLRRQRYSPRFSHGEKPPWDGATLTDAITMPLSCRKRPVSGHLELIACLGPGIRCTAGSADERLPLSLPARSSDCLTAQHWQKQTPPS